MANRTDTIIDAVLDAIDRERTVGTEAHRETLILPELIDSGDWVIHQSVDSAHTDLGGKVMTVPLGTAPIDGAVRLHEMAHVRWTTRDKTPPKSAAWIWVQAAEDRRLHDLLDRHVSDWRTRYGPAMLDDVLIGPKSSGIHKMLTKAALGDPTEIQRAAALYLAGSQTGDDRAAMLLDHLPAEVADEIRDVEALILSDPDDDDIAFKVGRRLVKFFKKFFTEDDTPAPAPDGGGGEPGDGEDGDSMPGGFNSDGETADGTGDGDPGDGGDSDGDPTSTSDAGDDGESGDGTPGAGGDGSLPDTYDESVPSGFDSPAPPPPAPRPTISTAPAAYAPPVDLPDYDTKAKAKPVLLGRDALDDLAPVRRAAVAAKKGSAVAPGTGEFLGHGLVDDKGKRITRPTEWGTMEIVKPALTVHVARQRGEGRRRRAEDRGTIPTRIHRYGSDKRVFVRKQKSRAVGGTILLDASGSMHLGTDDIERLVQHARHGTIAAYAGGRPDARSGRLAILAKDWKRVAEIPHGLFGYMNVVDGPGLIWLAKQPGPRIWISDGYVTGVGDSSSAALAREAMAVCNRYGITRYDSLEDYFADRPAAFLTRSY